MSSEEYRIPILEEAKSEIEDRLKAYFREIYVKAVNLAHKDEHPYIDKTYIIKASKQIKILGSNRITTALRIIHILMLPFVGIQLSGLLVSDVLACPIGLQITLWLLPLFSLFVFAILSWLLKDFLF